MSLFVQPVTKKNIDIAIKNILPYEKMCINLAGCLRKQKKFFDEDIKLSAFLKGIIIFSQNKTGKEFIGIILISAGFVILHCFPHIIPQSVLKYLCTDILKDIYITCIVGEKNNSIVLENAVKKYLDKTPSRSEDYKLLALNKLSENDFYKEACRKLNSEFKIIKPSLKEAEQICPLEMEYNRIEVLADGQEPSYSMCLDLLKTRIKKGLLITAKKENKFIAKALINASGFYWKQIGGVYTISDYRNKGVGAAVVHSLIKNCEEHKQKAALFVKVKNYPAQRLYEKLGFVKVCDFRIAYF